MKQCRSYEEAYNNSITEPDNFCAAAQNTRRQNHARGHAQNRVR